MSHDLESYLHYFLYHCIMGYSSLIFYPHSKRETRKKTNEMALGKNRMLQLPAIIMVDGHLFESTKQTNNTKAESKQIDPHRVSRRHARL